RRARGMPFQPRRFAPGDELPIFKGGDIIGEQRRESGGIGARRRNKDLRGIVDILLRRRRWSGRSGSRHNHCQNGKRKTHLSTPQLSIKNIAERTRSTSDLTMTEALL